MVAERMTEEGFEIIETSLPCLVTVVKEINEPRLPSLKGKMRAKKAELTSWKAIDLDVDETQLGLTGSPTWVSKIFTPPPRPRGDIFEGDPAEAVNKLADALKDRLK